MKESDTWNPPARLPIYEAIANDLRAVLAKRELNTKIESEPILAKRYQVSVPTLRNATLILEREGILARRQGSGTYIVGRGGPSVPGIPSSTNPFVCLALHNKFLQYPLTCSFHLRMAYELQQQLLENGINVRLFLEDYDSPAGYARVVEMMDAGQISCLVAMAATPACLLADAAKRHVPAYRNTTENNTLQVPSYLDYKQFSSMALEEIHRQGGQRVAMLAWWETGGAVDRRHFLSSAQALGLQTRDSWLIGDLDPKETSSGWAAFREFWTSSSEHPDSLIIADEALLPGALQAMADLGLKPQEDIRIVSHGNSPDLLPIVSRDVTRIWYALEDFVSANLRAIKTQLAGASLGSPVQIKPTLEPLSSTAKAPAASAHKPTINVKR